MQLLQQIGLVSETAAVELADLLRVSAALQKQATRDLSPIWSVAATVDSFASLEDLPVGYWPIIILDDVEGAAGVHLDRDGQPFALVEAGPSWSLTASHECLEMLVDPFGDSLVAGPSAKPNQGRVEFLVEICDPSEDDSFAYTVNGVLVSDFYTPRFFDPVSASGVRYSFGGWIEAPRTVLRGGYLSWHDPISDHWFQQTWFSGAKPVFVDLGRFAADDSRSIREIVDSRTPATQRLSWISSGSKKAIIARASARSTSDAAAAKANVWREQISRLRSAAAHERVRAKSSGARRG